MISHLLIGLGMLIFSSAMAIAGISKVDLEPFQLSIGQPQSISSEVTDRLKLCGERLDNGKQSCGLIRGVTYSDNLNSKVWRYESLVQDGELLVARDSGIIVGLVDETTGSVVLELECIARLSEYRYTLEEKVTAFIVTGMWPQASDDYSLYCVVP